MITILAEFAIIATLVTVLAILIYISTKEDNKK